MAASSSDFLHGADLEAGEKWPEARQGYDLQSDSQWFLCPSPVSQLSRTVPPTGDQVLKYTSLWGRCLSQITVAFLEI